MTRQWLPIAALCASSCSASTSSLHRAAAAGAPHEAERALAQGSKLDELDSAGNSALALAVEAGSEPIVVLLLTRGAAIDPRDARGTTPLMLAAALGRADIAALLLQRGARLDARDHDDRTVMHDAAMGNAPALVGALIAAGAIANHTDAQGQYPLHVVGEKQGPASTAIIATLLRAGNPIEAKDGNGLTALCRHAGSEPAVRELLDAGANPDADCGGDGPLSFAAIARDAETVRLLSTFGAALPTLGPRAARPLCQAALLGSLELLDQLLRAGVAVDASDGATALHHACMHNRLEAARMLLRHGANRHARAVNGPWAGTSAATCMTERPAMRALFDELE